MERGCLRTGRAAAALVFPPPAPAGIRP